MSVKYLGVWLDDKLIFNYHVLKTCEKARQASALTKIMHNMSGPGFLRRRMIAGVVNSIILYAAPVWASVININKYKSMLLSTQRCMLIKSSQSLQNGIYGGSLCYM